MPFASPTVLILRTAGTNGDRELAHAFELAGADARPIHLNRLIREPELLGSFDLLGIPGGFSYGDDISAGRILANRLRHRLYPALRAFVGGGKPVIGVCNGFQVLIKAGLLPGFDLPEDRAPAQSTTITQNTIPRFVDRWVGLRTDSASRCVWTRGLEAFALPIAHGEGRFLAPEPLLDRLEQGGQLALRYTDNPNGSVRDVAGICDAAGLTLGLMPHPERFTDPTHHPRWTRTAAQSSAPPPGLKIFQNAVEHVRESSGAAV